MLEAFALCPGGLPLVGTVCNSVSDAAGGVAAAGVGAIFSEAARWVASGAVWLIAQVGRAMSGTTSVDLQAGWFGAHEAVMASLAAAVVLPMACCAAIQAIYRQSASMLVRTFLVQLPLALLLTGVAVTLVRMALSVTDAMSAAVLSSAGVDTTNLFTGLFTVLVPTALTPVPGFVVLLISLFVAFAALMLWLELVVRAAAVSVAVLFLPLALAALVWPAVSHWCRRLADTLVALVLSKLVVAAVLSLAVGAIAGGVGESSSGNGGGFAAVVTGTALLFIAITAPFILLRLVPAVESGAIAHLESTRHRMKSGAASAREGGNLALDQVKNLVSKVAPQEPGTDAAAGPGDVAGVVLAGAATGGVGAAVGAAAEAGGVAAGASAAGGGATVGAVDADAGASAGEGVGTGPAIAQVRGNANAFRLRPVAPDGEGDRSRPDEEPGPPNRAEDGVITARGHDSEGS